MSAEIVAFPPRDPAVAAERARVAVIDYFDTASRLSVRVRDGLTGAGRTLALPERRASIEDAHDAVVLLMRMAGPHAITGDDAMDRSLRAFVALTIMPLGPLVLDQLRTILTEDA